MDNFSQNFEAAKIPEFYEFYFNYNKVKDKIKQFKESKEPKLHGFYTVNKVGEVC